MNIEIITPPPVYPLQASDLYGWLRLDPSGSPLAHPDDEMIEQMIGAVTSECEQATCRAFIEQTIRLTTGYWGICGIELLRPPFIGLVSVRYYDAENVLQTLAADTYFIEDTFVPRLRLAEGKTWPLHYDREDAIQITYTVGYQGTGSPTEDYRINVPPAIKTAIKIGVQLLYDNLRPEERDRLVMAQKSILASNRVYNFSVR